MIIVKDPQLWYHHTRQRCLNLKKEGEAMVELDQFKTILATYTEPLVEVRDSL